MSAPDLTSYQAVHAALRRAPHRLAAAARTLDPADQRRVKALARYWRGYLGEVVAHHTIEDDHFFPALVHRVPGTGDMIVRTDADHHHLDELAEACSTAIERLIEAPSTATASAAAESFEALAAHMDQHLDFEDADIVPLFARHFTVEEYAGLEDKAMKSLGIGAQAAFTVPFIAAAVDAEMRDHLFGDAPAAFRVLYRLTRNRHARLEALALGASRDEVPTTGSIHVEVA